MDTVKLCWDCRYRLKVFEPSAMCKAPGHEGVYCLAMRLEGGPCGRDGKLWEHWKAEKATGNVFKLKG